jgi:hypothetical protein
MRAEASGCREDISILASGSERRPVTEPLQPGSISQAERSMPPQAGAERSSAAHRQDSSPGEPISLKKHGAAIGAAGEELQVSGRKMAFGGGHDKR